MDDQARVNQSTMVGLMSRRLIMIINEEFGSDNNLTRVSMLMTALTEVAKLDLSLGRQNWFCVAFFDSAMTCLSLR